MSEVKTTLSFSGGKVSLRAIRNKKHMLSTVFINFDTEEEELLNLLLQQFIQEKVCVCGVNMNNGIANACATTKGIMIMIPESKIVSNILQIYNYLMKTELKSPQNKYLKKGSYKKLAKDISDFKVMITGKCKNFSTAIEDSKSKKMEHLKDGLAAFSPKNRADISNDNPKDFECCPNPKPLVYKGNKAEKLDLCIFLKDLPCVLEGDNIVPLSTDFRCRLAEKLVYKTTVQAQLKAFRTQTGSVPSSPAANDAGGKKHKEKCNYILDCENFLAEIVSTLHGCPATFGSVDAIKKVNASSPALIKSLKPY
jgi:hypothetical protein